MDDKPTGNFIRSFTRKPEIKKKSNKEVLQIMRGMVKRSIQDSEKDLKSEG